MLPKGRGVLEVVEVIEGVSDSPVGRSTALVAVSGVGRSEVQVDCGFAEAVVPFYHGPEDAGTWSDATIARDESGRWCLRVPVERNQRYCFAVLGPWGDAATPPLDPAEAPIVVRDRRFARFEPSKPPGNLRWKSLRRLEKGTERDQAILIWQARRIGRDGRMYRVAFGEPGPTQIEGTGLLRTTRHGTVRVMEIVRGE
jgi:hypothetical protein